MRQSESPSFVLSFPREDYPGSFPEADRGRPLYLNGSDCYLYSRNPYCDYCSVYGACQGVCDPIQIRGDVDVSDACVALER